MNEEKVKEIMSLVKKEWRKRYNSAVFDKNQLDTIKGALRLSPHEDGIMPVMSIETGNTYLVPISDIILYGLKGNELDKYPIQSKEEIQK